MDMQDKEIDHLFRSELESYEVEPSAKLWGNITLGMDAKKSRLKTYLSIAASVLILLSAGLYFVNGTGNFVKKPVQIAKVKKQEPAKQVVAPQVISPKVVQPQVENAMEVSKSPALRSRKIQIAVKRPSQSIQQDVTKQPEAQLAHVTQPAITNDVKFVVPDKQTPLVAKTDVPDDTQFKTTADVPQQVPATKSIAAAPAKKHRIRNLGDLINVVVSKVDKRKDKLIEFSSSKDEDESVLSGLNLGFIKIKKEDK
jgi:hypothetical protein